MWTSLMGTGWGQIEVDEVGMKIFVGDEVGWYKYLSPCHSLVEITYCFMGTKLYCTPSKLTCT